MNSIPLEVFKTHLVRQSNPLDLEFISEYAGLDYEVLKEKIKDEKPIVFAGMIPGHNRYKVLFVLKAANEKYVVVTILGVGTWWEQYGVKVTIE